MMNRTQQGLSGNHSAIRIIFTAFLILMAVSLAFSAAAEGNDRSNPGLGTGVRLLKKPNESAIRGSYQGEDVKVQILGVCRSYIFVGSKPQIINTSDLTFAEDLAPEEMLAYVQSASSARIYWGPELKGSLARCKPGTIFAVVAVGDNYVEVKYPEKKNAFRGFLKKSSVQLCGPAEGIGTGLVENGKQAVNIRAKMDIHSAKVESVKSGTEIIVISDTGNWYEVEYNGLHGYIRKGFVTLLEEKPTDETAAAEENGENAPAEENDGYAFADETDGTGYEEDNGGDAFAEENGDTMSEYGTGD